MKDSNFAHLSVMGIQRPYEQHGAFNSNGIEPFVANSIENPTASINCTYYRTKWRWGDCTSLISYLYLNIQIKN